MSIDIKYQIKMACDHAGISQTELAKRLGMSQPNFSKRLQVGKFTKEEYERMAAILDAEFILQFKFPDGTLI